MLDNVPLLLLAVPVVVLAALLARSARRGAFNIEPGPHRDVVPFLTVHGVGAAALVAAATTGRPLDAAVAMAIWFSGLLLLEVRHKWTKLDYLAWTLYLSDDEENNRYAFPGRAPTEAERDRPEHPEDSEYLYLFKLAQRATGWQDASTTARAARGREQLADTLKTHAADGAEWPPLKAAAKQGYDALVHHWTRLTLPVRRREMAAVVDLAFAPELHVLLAVGAFTLFLLAAPERSTSDVLYACLFGVAFASLCAYAVLAGLLYSYGRVLAFDRLDETGSRFGCQFFVHSAQLAVVMSAGVAISVGVGVPLALYASDARLAVMDAALSASATTAAVVFFSLRGTNHAMRATREVCVRRLAKQLDDPEVTGPAREKRARQLQAAHAMTVWPIDVAMGAKLLGAIVFPIVLQVVLDRWF